MRKLLLGSVLLILVLYVVTGIIEGELYLSLWSDVGRGVFGFVSGIIAVAGILFGLGGKPDWE